MRYPPEILVRAPILAVLEIVDDAMDTIAWELMHDLPALQDEPNAWRPEPPEQIAARRFLKAGDAFARALRRYERSIVATIEVSTLPATDDDIDF
jgi:hypothetical protein